MDAGGLTPAKDKRAKSTEKTYLSDVWALVNRRFQLCINQNAARSGCDLRYFLVREIRAATHLSLSPRMLPISAWE